MFQFPISKKIISGIADKKTCHGRLAFGGQSLHRKQNIPVRCADKPKNDPDSTPDCRPAGGTIRPFPTSRGNQAPFLKPRQLN